MKLGYHGTNIYQELRPGSTIFDCVRLPDASGGTCVAAPTQPASGHLVRPNPFIPNANPLNTLRAPIPTSVTQYIPSRGRTSVSGTPAIYLRISGRWRGSR